MIITWHKALCVLVSCIYLQQKWCWKYELWSALFSLSSSVLSLYYFYIYIRLNQSDWLHRWLLFHYSFWQTHTLWLVVLDMWVSQWWGIWWWLLGKVTVTCFSLQTICKQPILSYIYSHISIHPKAWSKHLLQIATTKFWLRNTV